jgi:hypothetical protein
LSVIAPGVIEALVTLQTFQFKVLAVGQATNVNPPLEPQPVTLEASEAKAVLNVEVVAKPVIVAVAADVQVLAEIALVGRVI